MKPVLFSAVAGVCLLATTAFAAAPEQRGLTRKERTRLEAARRDNDRNKLSRRERDRLEAARRDRNRDSKMSSTEKARLGAAYRAGQRN